MDRGIMSIELFNKLIDQLLSFNADITTFVLYHGGEPFLNKHIFEFIDTLKKYWPSSFVKTVSNGSLFTQDLICSIVASKLDQLEISIDSTSLQASDLVRRGSNSLSLISSINSLLASLQESSSSMDVCISSTQFFTPSGINDTPFSATPDASWLNEYLNYDIQVKTAWAMQWPRIQLPKIYLSTVYQDPSLEAEFSSHCDHVINTITVRSDGTVVPCCYDLLSDLAIDNILQNDIFSIWQSEEYVNLRDSIYQGNPCLTCQNCNTIRRDKRFLKILSN
jgi:radical SAM protein with 4Fe4S-binding SPASM domain